MEGSLADWKVRLPACPNRGPGRGAVTAYVRKIARLARCLQTALYCRHFLNNDADRSTPPEHCKHDLLLHGVLV